ncbi:MAG: hypothetical protein KKD28_00470 [Chloroflexi bacterium]|nr:hypothetical protein [Chloroflexota bacterium]
MSENAQWNNSRKVIERVFISGVLVLETPANLGSGDAEGTTDMGLLYDSFEERPLLTGASIAGALRNYLREYEAGFGAFEKKSGELRAERLFGHLDAHDDASVLSWLMVDDALGTLPENGEPVEIRDGVTIDPKSRTAEENKLYNIELLAAGTTFDLHFELWLTAENQENLESLVIALEGLEGGEIGLGRRKRRGYGQCRVSDWQVQQYKMDETAGLLGWLNHTRGKGKSYETILDLLDGSPTLVSNREAFTLEAAFSLKTSLLIRSDSGKADAVDAVHLRSWRDGKRKPILSGTSLAGVIRARALRIAKTVLKNEKRATDFVDAMFGKRIRKPTDEPTGSRVVVHETLIENSVPDRVQNRVKLDRFTGGAYPQALFSQQPVFGKTKSSTRVKVWLELRKTHDMPEEDFDAEVGLLLLVLKDLWTGDLPVGGESSVGRGRLQGESATLRLGEKTWELAQNPDGTLSFDGSGDSAKLEGRFLQRFLEEVQP